MNRSRNHILLGLIITAGYLLVNLAIINDYPVSWDYHYHFYGGLFHLGKNVPPDDEVKPIPFTPPDPRYTVEDPFGPVMSIAPTLLKLIFHDKLNILPFDSAFNLFGLVTGSLGIGLIYFFLLEAFGLPEALVGSIFFGLLPVHFGYIHTNMKDVPSAFFFALSVYLFWKLVKEPGMKRLILACIAFGVAFSIKINAVFIPVILLLWILFLNKKKAKKNLIWCYFIFAPLAALTLWYPFWSNPLEKLLEIPTTFSHNTRGMPVLLNGEIYRSGVNVPWFYSIIYISITTPPVILAGLLIFMTNLLKNIRKVKPDHLLLAIWIIIPLARYILPSIGIIDGVRHFLEIVYPLSMMAAVGMAYFLRLVKNDSLVKLLMTIVICLLGWNIVHYHPFETSYFNFLTGGIKGAQGKFDIDFWGTPQRDAVLFLNQTAPPNSYVNIAMDQASMALYIRKDLLVNLNKKSLTDSDFTVILNRQSFFNTEIKETLDKGQKENKILYSREIDGVPLVWVIKK